jgi:hypothetical protein
VVAQDWGNKKEWEVGASLMDTGSSEAKGKVLKLNGSDGCTTPGMYWIPMNCETVNFVPSATHTKTSFLMFSKVPKYGRGEDEWRPRARK